MRRHPALNEIASSFMKISINTIRPGVLLGLHFLFALFTLTGLAQTPPAPQRYVAISFDDLPVVCRCESDAERREITDKLLAIFQKFRIPVLGVVNEQKLESDGVPDPAKVALLQKWLDGGHELGNHGYAHRNINDIPMNEYHNEILMGERITRPLAQKAGIPYRFFRHPYLSAGDNLAVRKNLDDFLKRHHYVVAPNTITYQDYTFSGAYESALREGDTVMAQKIMDAYLPYTLSKWEAAEQQSRDLFGREIKQILMVHANSLNADAFGQVAKMMQDRGYVFISIDEALKDPAYARPDTFDGKVGVTWLSRWAAEMGSDNRPQSTQVPAFILDFISKRKK
jgi:peptidoglycan/xylan/chitin deacetylase (PgdA/CDA1 family)